MSQVPVTNGYAEVIVQGWQLVEVLPWTTCSGTTPVTSDVVTGLAAYRYVTPVAAVADNAISVSVQVVVEQSHDGENWFTLTAGTVESTSSTFILSTSQVAGDMLRVSLVPAETEEGSVAIKVTVFCN